MGLWKKKITRREFLRLGIMGLAGLGLSWYTLNSLSLPSRIFHGTAPEKLWKWSKEGYHYLKLGENVQCQLCPNQCILSPGDRGFCRVRVNFQGKLYTLVYGNPCAVHIDPIEKKPLFHFFPGSRVFSIATAGCNFRCLNCFPPETFVVIEKGPKRIEDVFVSGRLKTKKVDGAVVNEINNRIVTHTGEIKKVLHAFKHPYDGEIFVIKPYYLPEIKCTPSHKFFVRRGKEIEKISVKDIKLTDYIVIPKRYSFPRGIKTLDVKKLLSNPESFYKKSYQIPIQDIQQILEVFEKGFGSKEVEKDNKIKFSTEKQSWIPRFIKIDKEFAKLLGYYCGRGCVYKDKKRSNSYHLIFAFGKKERELAEETKHLMKKILGVEMSVKETKTNISVRCCETSVSVLFSELCGMQTKTKKIPWVINQSPKSVCYEFLKSYIKCDGSIQKDAISINTVSKDLAMGVYWLFLKLGFLPSFFEVEKTTEGRRIKQSMLYYVKIKAKKFREDLYKKCAPNQRGEKNLKFFEDENYYFVPIFRIHKIHYQGYVYNLEVEGHHSYLANFVAVGNCQNWEISQSKPEETRNFELFPKDVVGNALRYGCQSIAYTYSEPTVFYEYMFDTSKLATSQGLRNLWITNGYINEKPLKEFCKYLDAANVDLKSFSEEIYNKLNSGRLEPVLHTLKILKKQGTWLEITNLVIPTYTDSLDMIREMCRWIYHNLGSNYPLHFSRFHPHYKLKSLPSTSIETLEKAREIALDEGIKFVYIGNVPGHPAESTYCPKCGRILIQRIGYTIKEMNLDKGMCKFCGEKIPGVWE